MFYDNNRGKRQAEDYNPVYLEDLEFTDDQRKMCENNNECLFDFVVTGNTEVALTTLNDQKRDNATHEILSKCICIQFIL